MHPSFRAWISLAIERASREARGEWERLVILDRGLSGIYDRERWKGGAMTVERSCLSDRIRGELARRIIEGELKPGDRLVELRIAEEFASSQTPVREALRELEALRLVESAPYRGTWVRAVDEREMVEAYAVRGALERLACETAAPALRGRTAPLREIVAAMRAAAVAKDREEYARLNQDFHRSIVVASGNQTLLHMWDSLSFETRVQLTLARVTSDWPTRADWHNSVVDALDAGDGANAGRLLEGHARSFAESFLVKTPSLS